MIKSNHDLAVEFHASAATHVGLVRKSNQDRYFVGRLECREECVETDLEFLGEAGIKPGDNRFNFAPCGGSLLIVADGVGGHVSGDVAAEIAVASFVEFMESQGNQAFRDSNDDEFWVGLLHLGIQHCQDRILEHQHLHPECAGMGTTFSACVLVGSRAYIVHAGDSRIYLARGRKLIQLTTDQTIGQRLVEEGGMTPRQASQSQLSHCVWSALGGTNISLEPQVFGIDIQSQDKLLLCSDGLTNELGDRELNRLLSGNSDAVHLCVRMIERALEIGARDNVTVVVGEYVSIGSYAVADPENSEPVHNLVLSRVGR